MYSEDDFIQLSSVQHFAFCPRQCGLIHVHGLWEENLFTARGRVLHERVDSGEEETRGPDHIVRSLSVFSREYGLSGKADVVEFRDNDGRIIPYPVEYKSGKPKPDERDMVQLCAQALCLEEMMGSQIPEAALFYGKTRHRVKVPLTVALRETTVDIIRAVHSMMNDRTVPEGVYDRKCDTCSLNDLCMPKLRGQKIKRYMEELFTGNETAP